MTASWSFVKPKFIRWLISDSFVRARLDCLAKPSDIMHLTKILNLQVNFIFLEKSMNQIVSKHCHDAYWGQLRILLDNLSSSCSFDKPLFVRGMIFGYPLGVGPHKNLCGQIIFSMQMRLASFITAFQPYIWG